MCVLLHDEVGEFVFTDCNGGVKQAEKINRFAELIFHQRFSECFDEETFSPEKFNEVFPEETLPEDSMDIYHIFDNSQLRRWIFDEKKRSCPICNREIQEIVLCPYLTQKFGGRLEEPLKHPPLVEKLTGEHVVNVQPSSVFQDPDSMLKLFLVEMAHLMKHGVNSLAEDYAFNDGLISWCIERDPKEAQSLLDVIHREKALSYANVMVLTKNPLVDVLKQNIDAYLESLGPQGEEQLPGAQMQLFIQCFFGDNTNWTFFNSLMSHANLTLTYELTDLTMVPEDKRRFVLPNINFEEVKALSQSKQRQRVIVGLIFAGFVLLYCAKKIHSIFRRSEPIPKN